MIWKTAQRHAGTIAFLIGAGVALGFSGIQMRVLFPRYQLIPSLLTEETRHFDFLCRTAECAACLHGLQDNPDAIVFTAGSTFDYALNFTDFAKAMPRPVVNCMKNDSRMDAYRSFFSYARFNQAGQIVFHGYNSWAVNSPGTWAGDRAASFFALFPPSPLPPPPAWVPASARPAAVRLIDLNHKIDLVLLYAHLFLNRLAVESPLEWRARSVRDVPGIGGVLALVWPRDGIVLEDLGLKYLPLSKEAHMARRLRMMRHRFSMSAYVRTFMIDAFTQLPAADIAARHEEFLAAIAPTRRVVFFPGPELDEIFPDRVKAVMANAKRIMLETMARHPDVRHVEPGYRQCGLRADDFWFEGAMLFDIPHTNADAKGRMTTCLLNAIKTAGLEN